MCGEAVETLLLFGHAGPFHVSLMTCQVGSPGQLATSLWDVFFQGPLAAAESELPVGRVSCFLHECLGLVARLIPVLPPALRSAGDYDAPAECSVPCRAGSLRISCWEGKPSYRLKLGVSRITAGVEDPGREWAAEEAGGLISPG